MARERRRRRGGSADESDAKNIPKAPAFIKRKIPHYSILSDDDLSIIEDNADTILEEIGIVFSEDQEALDILEKAGASIDGMRVRFPKGMCRKLIQENAPKQFTQFARNPERNVEIGGDNMVLVPAYGPPFVHDLDEGRRYATIEDFRNFIKLLICQTIFITLVGRFVSQLTYPLINVILIWFIVISNTQTNLLWGLLLQPKELRILLIW